MKKITNKEFCNQSLLPTELPNETDLGNSSNRSFSLEESKKELTSVDTELQYVSRTEGAYGVSKRNTTFTKTL